MRAGLPVTNAYGGTSLVTTAPAPTSAHSPTVTPQRMVALLPIAARRPIRVGTQVQSSSSCGTPFSRVERGKGSLMNITPCPMNASSSIVTPEQMKL